MPLGNMPLLSMLRTRMKWHSERQNVLAENVANADVPNYKARDLAELKFNVPLALGPQRTDPGHLGAGAGAGAGGQGDLFARNSSAFEITPSGNSVSLEDEMVKAADNFQGYEQAASLYQKSLGLLSIAIGRGRSA